MCFFFYKRFVFTFRWKLLNSLGDQVLKNFNPCD